MKLFASVRDLVSMNRPQKDFRYSTRYPAMDTPVSYVGAVHAKRTDEQLSMVAVDTLTTPGGVHCVNVTDAFWSPTYGRPCCNDRWRSLITGTIVNEYGLAESSPRAIIDVGEAGTKTPQ
jgi:hypothetical protein